MIEEIEKIKKNLVKPVVFIGLMGAGKTETGKAFAALAGKNFVDSDDLIIAREKMTIPEIFNHKGEAHFRTVERAVIKEALNTGDIVLSVGGGAVMNEETAALIWSQALSVYLDADVRTLVARTADNDERPLLKTGNPADILAALKEKRSPVYAKADITVDSNGTPEDVLNGVVQGLTRHLSL